MQRIGNKVSYIRKPLAKYSLVSAGLTAVSFLFCGMAIGIACHAQGDAPHYAAALGFCSLLTAGAAAAYGIFSFFEKEKNYLLAKICLGCSGTLMFCWLVMILIS